MANHKTGKNLNCPNCGKDFYIIASRIKLHKNHYCSVLCLSRYTAPIRSKKLSKTIYPKICGQCKQCLKDIIAKNASFNKPNRKFCSISCQVKWRGKNIPFKWTDERRRKAAEKMSKTFKGIKRPLEFRVKLRNVNLGNKSHFWKGGLTDKNRLLRTGLETRLWREAIFKRDNWTCVDCKVRGGKLEADHIKPWSLFPELRFAIDNGRTLCKPCHRKTDTFGYKLIRKVNCKL